MMRLGFLMFAACLMAAGCGDDNPTTPTNLPLVFTARLSPANEVPPIGNAEAVGRGAVQVTFNVTRDSAGAVTGGTAAFHFQLSDFPDSTTFVAAHIHPGVAGVNGPVIVNTGINSSTAPVSSASATDSFNTTGTSVDAATMNGIINNPSAYYFNVHSFVNPGGVARGQLARIQ
jgi:hypothetical protein